ncbi:glycosyltransferase family 9 protein [Streptomyces sudanensis]|uniref:glycosyltransferase family 9 protein n=1 Tax=Streptomyces sudanensis TaxID=436397 RepID=UPI0020CE9782|nr:glycosyltransferase family 9 protein [Streptomyces sudanensis]MCP9960041.1 glycosyltransferase family 9 protein [Streptomyces sudanensis]MCP9999562.1 glycosyltransferase family 9 protein [Streptomyces sudanensis]
MRPRVLVLRALGLGDLLAGVPALRAVRRGFPGHEVVLAAPRSLADAVAALDAVDALLPASAPGRAVPVRLAWPGPPPEAAVDLHGRGPSSHLLLERTRPGRLLAFAHPGTPQVRGPAWTADEHERDRWCRLLEWYGLPADPGDLRLPPPREPSPAPGAVVVHPGAAAAARRWPPERYARVVRELRRRGHRVVLTGGPGEDGLLARVAGPAGLGARDVLAGGLPYGRLAALCARSAAVVSGDTGVAHVAAAYGAPSVTLFGPVPPHLWGPPPDPRHAVLWHPGPPGDPHGREPDPRLLRIEPDEVLAALLPRLGAPPA